MTITLISFLFGGFGLAFFVGSIVLQIHLSKKENKYLGLILPAISFVFSLIGTFGMTAFTVLQETSVTGPTERPIMQSMSVTAGTGSMILQALWLLFLYNIPTLILTAIYLRCRKLRSKSHEIDRMNILDLE